MTIDAEVAEFKRLVNIMADTFAKKRNDYGQSTTETFEKFGPVSMLVRMHDKMARLDRILGQNVERQVNESAKDTLLDLANYAIITIIELDKEKVRNVGNEMDAGICRKSTTDF